MSTLQGLAANALATMFCCCSKKIHPTCAGAAQSAQYGGIARQFKDKASSPLALPAAKN
jgi:hypothetical protein